MNEKSLRPFASFLWYAGTTSTWSRHFVIIKRFAGSRGVQQSQLPSLKTSLFHEVPISQNLICTIYQRSRRVHCLIQPLCSPCQTHNKPTLFAQIQLLSGINRNGLILIRNAEVGPLPYGVSAAASAIMMLEKSSIVRLVYFVQYHLNKIVPFCLADWVLKGWTVRGRVDEVRMWCSDSITTNAPSTKHRP